MNKVFTSCDQKYRSNNDVVVIHEDCVKGLTTIADKTIQTICIDPPYNIGKDHWDRIDNYIDWLTSVIQVLQEKLKDNGSFFLFHNDMEQIAELMISIKKNTRLKFRQLLVWNKRFPESPRKGYMDGFLLKESGYHNWSKMAEYILFYTFDNYHKLKEARERLNISQLTISSEILSKTGGLTGWYSNLETGKNAPTRETIVPIKKHLHLDYDDIVPKFHNQKTHHSVWNYDIAKRNKIHLTPKPIDLLENIIKHTSDPGDILLDCFAGTGSLGRAALNTGRKCILIEKEEEYYNFIVDDLQLCQ